MSTLSSNRPPESATPQTEVIVPNMLDKKEWHIAAEQIVDEAQKSNKVVSALFLDLNYFSEVNNHLGHEEGDRVIDDIKGLVARVSESFRAVGEENDDNPIDIFSVSKTKIAQITPDTLEAGLEPVPGHIGGDEFAVIAETDLNGALAIARSIKEVISEYINLPENIELAKLDISVAVGVADLQVGMTVSELLRSADEAMYIDKFNQLPELKRWQKVAFGLGKLALKSGKIRLRDVVKYQNRKELQAKSRKK